MKRVIVKFKRRNDDHFKYIMMEIPKEHLQVEGSHENDPSSENPMNWVSVQLEEKFGDNISSIAFNTCEGFEYERYDSSYLPDLKTHPHLKHVSKCYQTKCGTYDILFDEVKGYEHLRVSRIDKQPLHNYMDLQRIKNDLLGKDKVAVEIFPKQSDFVNGSNTYHIWSWNALDHYTPNLKELYTYSEGV